MAEKEYIQEVYGISDRDLMLRIFESEKTLNANVAVAGTVQDASVAN